ncbi:hypothetical protein K5I29_04760 [Flavobacterium agricola]|uniref:Phosphoribosylpyrophosphate synthetase n=1 Tax=Flavobacterium agricola TaxID=2870839 RepID=A0ABY6M301_9FLAO|nr:hypothetical protein [Flavobacterium agricola]UYW02217.1 hypothetical protein K5I29_04760 [Flavobacterium agricola]
MEPIYKYETTTVALEQLNNLGYTKDFNVDAHHLQKHLDDVIIDYVYRYEGNSNPGDESLVLGLTLGHEKGVFVSGFSANSNNDLAMLLWKKISHKF